MHRYNYVLHGSQAHVTIWQGWIMHADHLAIIGNLIKWAYFSRSCRSNKTVAWMRNQ